MNFEWDPRKAIRNLRDHAVPFHEAATVFGDPLALTYHDPDHSVSEQRFVTLGVSKEGRILIVAHTDRGENIRIISAGRRLAAREITMKTKSEKPKNYGGLRPEYDLSELTGGVRGKYTARYKAGTNLVLLSPDVAAHFPDDRSVNAALRKLIPPKRTKNSQRRRA